MSLKSRIAAAVILTALTGTAAAPAVAACGEVVDATCVARESVEAARKAEHPQGRIQLMSEAAYYLPADEATALLVEARSLADALTNPGFRGPTQLYIAGVMSDLGMAEGITLGREQAAALFENGPDDPMLIQMMGPEAATTEQIKRIAWLQAMHGDVEGAEITVGYQASEADKVDTMFTVAEVLAARHADASPAGNNEAGGNNEATGDNEAAGNNEAAERLLRQAMARLAQIDDPARADEIKLNAIQALARMGWIDEALALIQTTAEIAPRVWAIATIVQVLAEAGEVDRARELYARIAGLAANDNALWPFSVAVARAGDLKEARAMMRDMINPVMRDQAIADLAGIQAGMGDLNGAMDAIADLPEGFARNRGLRLVLTAMVEAGRLEQAEDYAASLADPGLRTMIIAPIAAAQARAGDHAKALATARAQPTTATRAKTLLAVAKALAEEAE